MLKSTGSIFLHCDPTASHYLKIVMDCIFGKKNFLNEIVWCYGGRGMSKRWFNKKHDTILFYGKTKEHFFSTERASRPVEEKYVGRYNKVDEDGKKYAKIKNKDGSYSNIYLKDVVREDWWNIPYVRGDEYVGYPTQKPLALLERIVEASSNEGDLVLDPFCGCTTTIIAAEKLNRKWVGIDASPYAKHFVKHRVEKDLNKEIPIIFLKKIAGRSDLQGEELSDYEHKKKLYEDQQEKCNGCTSFYHHKDLTVDHIIPTAKGGQDTQDNKQLLCFHCNITKGTGSMETLKHKLRKAGILEEHE